MSGLVMKVSVVGVGVFAANMTMVTAKPGQDGSIDTIIILRMTAQGSGLITTIQITTTSLNTMTLLNTMPSTGDLEII